MPFGIGFRTIGTILSLIVIGPPLVGMVYTVWTSQPMPVFAPHDIFSKAGYGATWGFWTFWQWVRPLAGMTGGAQVAVGKIKDGTIGSPTTIDDVNASQSWNEILLNLTQVASTYNLTDYYIQYANTVGVDINKTWQLTLYIVSNDGTVLLSRFDAVWTVPPDANMALFVSNPPTEVSSHYGVAVTLDSINIAAFMMNSSQVDWGKLGMDTLQTLYKGNVQAWVVTP